ncbi:proton-conducting transporter transmembrane domain-containing protein [Anaplasma platys]|nr:proton-conducting transporter membrane subunit [Anaplasma platys]
MGLELYNVVFEGLSTVRGLFSHRDGAFLFDLDHVSALVCACFLALLGIVLAARGSLREVFAALLYAVSGVAALCASSLMQVVEFFEVMAIAALLLIAFGGREGENSHAVLHYACVHFLSGVMLLVGAIQYSYLGSLEGVPRLLFMGGLLISASSFPLAAWVLRAYSQVSAFGFMVLPLFTTKAALFILLSMFHGETVILYLGMLTAVYAVVFAVIEENSRNLVSYGIVGQMGLLLMSVGCGVVPKSVLVAQLSFAVLCQLLFILVTEHNMPRSEQSGKTPSRIRLASVEMLGLVVALLNMASFPGTVSFASSQLAGYHSSIEDFSYAVYQYTHPVLVLGLFMCVGLKFLSIASARKESTGALGAGNLCSKTAIVLLSIIVVLLGIFYGQGMVLPDHKLTYTLNNVVTRVAVIAASIACFVLFRRLFQGRYQSAAGEGWLYIGFFKLVNKAKNFASFARETVDGYNLNGDMFGVELGEQDAVLSSREPTGLISSVLLFVMLCICVGMGLCLTL